MDKEDATTAIEALDQADGSFPAEATILLKSFRGKNAKSAKVLRLSDSPQSLVGSYAFEAKEAPLFARVVRLYGPKPAEIARLVRLGAILPNGVAQDPQPFFYQAARPYVYAYLHKLISGFTLQPKKARVAIAITKIEVVGHPFSSIESAEDALQKIVKIREKISAYRKESLADIDDLSKRAVQATLEVEGLNSSRDLALEQHQDASAKLDAVRLELQASTEQRDRLIAENGIAKNNFEQLSEELTELNKDVAKGTVELRQLKDDRRMISDEFSSFVEEGRGQTNVYGWLSIIPLLAACAALICLLRGGWDLATLTAESPSQAYAYLLQRLPYTMATIAIAGILLEIVRQMIRKIMSIHEDRLALARLLVVARDATYAAASGLDMSEEDIFKERMLAKMELLKMHMDIGGKQETSAQAQRGSKKAEPKAAPN